MGLQRIENLGEFGCLADLAPVDVPPNAFSRVVNMRFRDGYAERIGGLSPAAPLTPPAAAPLWVQPYTTSAARYWLHATSAGLYADDGTTLANITGSFVPTATRDTRYTGGVLSGIAVFNSGADVPQYWPGTGNVAPLPGWNANWRARSLRPFKAFLVAVGVTKSGVDYPHLVKWSSAADPGAAPASWDETDATLDAGEVDLAETPDLMVDQLPMGDANIIYKDQSMWEMRYIGAPLIFAFRRLPGKVGAAARGCITDTPLGHVVLTYGDVVLHNGQGPTSILNRRMRKWLKVRMSTEHFRRSFLCTNWATNEVWVCFPESGRESANLALVWNWVDNTLGVRDLPGVNFGTDGRMPVGGTDPTWTDLGSQTWDDLSGAWDEDENNASETRLLLAVNSPAALVLADQGDADGVATYPAVLERTGLAFDSPETVKTCRGLFLRVDAPTGAVLSVEIGAAMSAEEAPVYSPAVTYTVGESFQADGFATGRFLAYRITSTAAFPWRIASLEFDLVPGGRY